jgi:hypothetical protein
MSLIYLNSPVSTLTLSIEQRILALSTVVAILPDFVSLTVLHDKLRCWVDSVVQKFGFPRRVIAARQIVSP